MYYNYYQSAQYEYDECVSKGICSKNPTLVALQEIILLHIKELSFYLAKLNLLGVNNEKIRNDIIYSLSSITCNAEYNQSEFHSIITNLYNDLTQAKNIYLDLCQRHNLESDVLKTYLKHTKVLTLTDAIKKGEKHIQKKNKLFSEEQKNLSDIMLFLVKSLCIKLGELQNLEQKNEEASIAAISLLSTMNFPNKPVAEIKQEIKEFIEIYYKLIKQIYQAQIKAYGERGLVEVPQSVKAGKTILVASADLKELERVLEATKDKGINVYTHGLEMLISHTFPHFRKYKHLAGHWGSGIENCLLDFATFPGPILMTKHTMQKIEYLYRGRMFTTDIIAPRGIVKIHNNNFEPLISAALESKGFSKAQPKPTVKVGFDEKEIMAKINEVFDKIDSGEIKHFYILGLLNYSSDQKEYFERFITLLPKNCFALSLSFDKSNTHIMHVDSLFDYVLVYKVIKEIRKRKPLNEYKISLFLTKCDKHTIANVLNMKDIGIRDVYMCKCSPTLVNPSLAKTMRDVFDVKEFFDPALDMAATLKD